ncbi:MAG: HD domain-containing phosphohydrolase [Sterolibacterium sp.]
MISFKRKVALQIAAVSVVLASVVSPLAWYVSRENAEKSIVSFAMEESHRVLVHHEAIALEGPDAKIHAEAAARSLSGGLFDIAEVYGANGNRLAEDLTEDGERIEKEIPHHPVPRFNTPFYESFRLSNDRWVLRVFVPLHVDSGTLTGYFEGVRLIPDWQTKQIFSVALTAALMVCLASLVCGGILYPVVIRLASDNERKAQEVLESHISMMEALGRAIAKRDSDTGAHNYRVAWIAATLADAVGLSGGSMQALIAGSFLHDAGKIGIPDAILLKPGKLTEDEMDIMRTHVAMGEQIVTGAGWLDGGKDVVASHHEKWDGSGYPRGQTGDAIPLVARIFAIVDVFDALCAKRPYKEPLTLAAAMEILQQGAGTHFDPSLLKVFSGLAANVYSTAINATESEVRTLMEGMVRKHFGV